MRFSAFSRFGTIEFSSKKPDARKVYESLNRAMGDNFSTSFNGSHTQAKAFAQSMAIGATLSTLKRVKNNAIAKKATDLLGNLEAFYGVTPQSSESLFQRRQNLHARMLVASGGRFESVWEMMTALLGADFEEWVTATPTSLVRFPNTAAEAKDQGNDVPVGAESRVMRTIGEIVPGQRTVAVTQLSDVAAVPSGQIFVGRTFVADPISETRREQCAVEAFATNSAGAVTSITATFQHPHDAGVLMTTQRFQVWRSNAQKHFFKLSPTATFNVDTRRKVNVELARTLKSVATWSSGESGPFLVGSGKVGITSIGTLVHSTSLTPPIPPSAVTWLQANRVQTIWGNVNRVVDQTGNGNHVIATAEAQRTHVLTSWRNGKPAIQGGNPTHPRLQVTFIVPVTSGNYAIYFVAESSSVNQYFVDGLMTGERVIASMQGTSPYTDVSLNPTAVENDIEQQPPTGTAFLMKIVVNGPESEWTVYQDGAGSYSVPFDATGSGNLNGLTIMGLANTTAAGLQDPFAAAIVVDEPSSSEDDAIIAYLLGEYDIRPA